jgi:radical SAM superfamily enzyme YgiQ (UPF0313 family)
MEEPKMTGQDKKKILLLLLPYWDPEIPPLGISCLKSYLQPHGYRVRTVDGNTEKEFRAIYFRYYRVLEEYIPAAQRENFLNAGAMLMRNHLMAHINAAGEGRYIQLVKMLIEKVFAHRFGDNQVKRLNGVIGDFYDYLGRYFLRLLDEEKPDVVGFTALSGTLPASLFACRLVRQRDPAIQTVLGGQVFSDQLTVGTADFEDLLDTTAGYVDSIIIGAGEDLFLEWLEGNLPAAQRVYTLEDIDHKTVDLDTVDIPDYSDFDLSYYPHIALYGSRSCPYQCSFCSETVYWGKYRKKKTRHLVEEFKRLYELHGYQLFLLTDSLLNPIVSELAREILDSGFCFYWDGYLRADPPACDVDNTLLWRRGGFYRAKLGLESGSPHVLQKMGKHIDIERVKEAVCALAYAGIKTTTAWLVGHPEETEEDFRMTLDLVEELKDNIYEVKCQSFKYYLKGQPGSQQWMKNRKPVAFYPDWAKKMLISQTWRLDCDPSWEETLARENRFIGHCRRLGLPSNYSLEDVHGADLRWKKLQPNAAPPLVELKNKNNYSDESKLIGKLYAAVNPLKDNDEWL